jgi:hypothetical protein
VVPAGAYEFTVVADVLACDARSVTIPLTADVSIDCRRREPPGP